MQLPWMHSAFYPGGGGQPHDTGWLEIDQQKIPVIRVRKTDEDVWHEIDPAFPLPSIGHPSNGNN